MTLGRYFIDRPVFAIALSVATLIIGAVAASRLPVSQYPEVIPPTVTVTAQYPGASAKTIADTVATPIEQEVNGVDDMIYMQSQSTQDGRLSLTVTFRIGTDLDKAQVLVQNRVALAEPRLPEVVRRIGVTVAKNSPDFLLVVQLVSPDRSRDQLYLSNYATQQIVPVLSRLPGIGSVQMIAARDYAMRVWLDPDKVAEMGLSAEDVVAALRSQNVQVAGGVLAQPPVPNNRAFQPSISVQGRFTEPAEFEQIIIKRTDDGRIVRVKDVGRVELGARDYGTNAYINETSAIAMLVFQRPGTNALDTSTAVQKAVTDLGRMLPSGVETRMTYNPTEFFVRTSIEALEHTIYEAIALVVFVVIIFLQNGRATIIPLLAIPVSLVGTFAAMAMLGYTINTLTLFALLVGTAAWIFTAVPRGFVPAADQGYVIAMAQLPPGASLQRTDEIVREMGARAREIPGVEWVHMFPGRSAATGTQSASAGVVFVQLEAFEKRKDKAKSATAVRAELQKRYADITGAQITIIAPPTIRGIGASGGFSLRIQDINNRGSVALEAAARDLVAALTADPRIQLAFTPFSANAPEFFVDIDRTKAEMLGVPVSRVHETLEAYLGSAYANDFNLSGRTYQVIVQAEGLNRLDIEQIAKLKARSDTGAMVPLGSLATFESRSAPDRVPRYNLYPTAEVLGSAVPSVSSGEALDIVEEIAAKTLPDGYTVEWTELSYQQRLAGGGIVVFILSVVFVFLVLASQYESWSLPLAVILIVPMCLLSAMAGIMWMGQDNNILTQVGLVVLVGLAAKNAILIIEFARDLEAQGQTIVDAVVEACRLRLRPILMTSFAFILGVVPLMIAEGAGAELRQAIGTAVFFGMLGVTVFGLIFTPVFYAVIRKLTSRWTRSNTAAPDTQHNPATAFPK